MKELESKVADLERRLKRAERYATETRPQESHYAFELPSETPLTRTIRDASMNASGYNYLGGTSNVTIARVLEPVLHIDRTHSVWHDEPRNHRSQRAASVHRASSPSEEEDVLDVTAFCDPVTDRLFQAYTEYVSLIFPIMHSRRLHDMHARREKPNGLFEIAVLHLVYALGGITLNLVGQIHVECVLA